MTAFTLSKTVLVEAQRVRRQDLSVRNGRFVAAIDEGLRIPLDGHLVFPGLVNAHDHLQLNALPRPPLAVPFSNSYDWIAAFQAHFRSPSMVEALSVPTGLRLWQGGLKNLFAGTTTVAHHDPWHAVLDDPAFPVRLLRRFGWCHSLGLAGAYGLDVVSSRQNTPVGAPWMIHLAEGTDEIAGAELDRLEALVCLGPDTLLIHGVGLDQAQQRRVLERGAGLVWCPASNLSVLGKTLDPRPYFEAGRLALGTDSRISGSKDLLGELRAAAGTSDLSAGELLDLASALAARLLGLDKAGKLEAGHQADFFVIEDRGADPRRELLNLERSELRAVVLDGRPAIADPDLEYWFEACQVLATPVRLDGRPKLCARTLLPPGVEQLEPGLECPYSKRGGV